MLRTGLVSSTNALGAPVATSSTTGGTTSVPARNPRSASNYQNSQDQKTDDGNLHVHPSFYLST